MLPLLALSWLPFLVLQRGRRYKAAARRAWEEEQAHPHFVLGLMPTEQSGLTGGYFRV